MAAVGDDSRRLWVAEWLHKNGGHGADGPKVHALKLLEEVIELCYAAGARSDEVCEVYWSETNKAKARGESNGLVNWEAVNEECADVAFCLDVVTIHSGVDLGIAVGKKIPVLEARKWSPDAYGVLRRPR